MPGKHWLIILLAAIASGVMAWDAPRAEADALALPPGFEETSLGDDNFLSKPTHVEFAPDGRIFVLDEGYGLGPGTTDGPQVKVKEPGSGIYKRLFKLNHVNVEQDRGIAGMALDKDFGTAGNNFMYLLYTYEHTSGGPSKSSAARTQRLTRVTVPNTVPPSPIEPAETVLLGSVGVPVSTTQACPYPKTAGGQFDPNGSWTPYQKIDCIPSDSTEHAVNSVVVDPRDGTLWVSIGDGAAGGDFADPLAFRAQAVDSLSGKLLHIDRNGKGLLSNGTCPAGVTDLDRNCAKVYARGLRNPFRFSFRPDGKIAVGDPGWKSREEIDLLSSGGKNLGWPCYEGTLRTPLWKDRPECAAFYAASTPHQLPIYEYPYPPDTFGAAVILGPTYQGSGQPSDYPEEYKGGLFFSDYVSSKLSYLKLSADGSLLAGYPKPFGEVSDAVSWQLAPDGDLVYVDIGFQDEDPGVRAISAVENHRPQARITGGPTYGDTPLMVDLDGSGSSDPDPGETATLSYSWDLDDDDEFDDSTAANPPPRQYAESKNVDVKLKVTDVNGKSDTATLELQPGNNPPDEPGMEKGTPTTYRGGEVVELAGSTDDPDSGDVATLRWSARINHAGTHTHDLGTGSGGEFSFRADTVHDQPSTYEVHVYAEDERGLESPPLDLVLQPETSALHVTSTPSGASVNHGGIDHVTPYTGKSTIGVQVGISAASTLISGGVSFLFDNWSNGGARSQTLTMPAGGLTLNAGYRAATLSPPIAPGGEPDSAPPKDSVGPALLFNPRRGLINRRKALLWGVVRDPSGVRRVLVGLRSIRKQRGRCRWWSPRGGLTKLRSCRRPAYMPARLRGDGKRQRWILPLRGRLRPGRYLVFFRTVDRAGNAGFGPGGRRAVQLRVQRNGGSAARHARAHDHQRANH